MTKEDLAVLCNARDELCGFCANNNCEQCQVTHLIDDAYEEFQNFTIYEEVRIDFFDEETKTWCVDAWYHDNDEGIVVARINSEECSVEYLDENAENDAYVKDCIDEFLANLINKN